MLGSVLPAATASTPLLQLGSIAVANHTATVTGTLASGSSNTTLAVNGQPVGVASAGAFSAVVSLNGASSLSLALDEAGSRQQTTFEIPLSRTLLGPGGVIPAGALDSLEQAGVSLLGATGGTSGEPLTVSGAVLDQGNLSTLTLNGKDVLGSLGAGHTFTMQLPGTTKFLSLSATDKRGASQTIQAPLTVAAKDAVGVRFKRIAFYTKAARKQHRVRMVVTVRDLRGLLVQGATVSVRSTKSGRLLRQPKSALTGPKGSVTIVLPLRAVAFGERLTVNTVARTPSAKVSRKDGVRIPSAKSKARRL
jgi:hypothetical protein